MRIGGVVAYVFFSDKGWVTTFSGVRVSVVGFPVLAGAAPAASRRDASGAVQAGVLRASPPRRRRHIGGGPQRGRAPRGGARAPPRRGASRWGRPYRSARASTARGPRRES